jgi:hypothetical protein
VMEDVEEEGMNECMRAKNVDLLGVVFEGA